MARFAKGYRPDMHEVRMSHRSAREVFGAAEALPQSASLIPHTPPIADQGPTSSCVGFASWRAIDTRLARMGASFKPHSPLGIYGFARLVSASPSDSLDDDGCMPSDAVSGMQSWGVPLESVWPFDPAKVNAKPPLDVVEQASAFKVTGLLRIDGGGDVRIQAIKQAISLGYPIIFGTQVDEAFEAHPGKGVVQPCELSQSLGGHMLTVLAYDGEVFRGANSWGTEWGDSGFFDMGHDFLLTNAGDFYAINIEQRGT